MKKLLIPAALATLALGACADNDAAEAPVDNGMTEMDTGPSSLPDMGNDMDMSNDMMMAPEANGMTDTTDPMNPPSGNPDDPTDTDTGLDESN